MTQENQAAAVGEGLAPVAFERPLMSAQDIFAKSATLSAQVEWTLMPAVEAEGDAPARDAHYVGLAPFGRFTIKRVGEGLQGYFENTAEIEHSGEGGSFNALISLSDCESVAVAKASIVRKLLEAMNQVRRDDPLLDEAPSEEDPF